MTIHVFKFKDYCINTDCDLQIQQFKEQGAEEVEDLSIFKGYEAYVSPDNCKIVDGEIIFTPPKVDLEECLKTNIVYTVQQLLDAKAQERGYDNSFTLASYATSTVPKFKQEAQDFITWRDAVWTKCYSMLDDYLAGNIARPTVDDVLQQLPTLEWTNEN